MHGTSHPLDEKTLTGFSGLETVEARFFRPVSSSVVTTLCGECREVRKSLNDARSVLYLTFRGKTFSRPVA